MSNETVLDWLARNVHVWPKNTPQVIAAGHEKFELGAVFCEKHIPIARGGFPDNKIIYKHQWLARRAELQNKPSWKDAPEWANWLAKDSPDKDEKSAWWWYADKPVDIKNTWQVSTDGRAMMASSCHCDLGDWRGTLEKRPEKFKPSIDDVAIFLQNFKKPTSIEDNQEQDMKQDNGWFERGELPPVGTVCEYTLGANAPWYRCEIKYVIRCDGVVMKRIPCGDEQYCGLHHRNPVLFRPIRTERDALLSVIVEEMNHYDTDGKLADAILAAGFSLRAK